MKRWLLLACLKALSGFGFFLCLITYCGQSYAGLVASEVVVAVNGNSNNSRTLANHYVKLREIPAVNVIVLDSVPHSETISVELFRERILKPIIEQIGKRGLSTHVQCIAYSADFPTAIDIKKDLESIKNLQPIFTPVASINGLTYLYELSLVGNPAYIAPDVNYYSRRSLETYFANPVGAALDAKWKSINDLISKGNRKEAIVELEQLSQSLPFQFPLRYLAAAQAAQGDQPETAVKLLESAISSGWSSGGYLSKDKRFDSVRKRDDFQLLEILLDKDLGRWQPTVGFNNRSFWAANGVRFQTSAQGSVPGVRYLLSTVLGVTRGSGTTLDEAIESLRIAATADFTHPDGVFYYAETTDIRSQTRKPLFNDAIEELKAMGFQAEIVRTHMPMLKDKVLGAQLGTALYDWKKSSSTLLPGSLVDNLTSYGGVMAPGSGQTKLTEALKMGAAGSSGTVTEPFALQFKFPDPYLFVHYASGCCLAEAFYQSITGPYQLLIVGDPICQPFSHAPKQEFDKSLRLVEENSKLQLQVDVSGPRFAEWLKLPGPRSQRKEHLAPSRLAVQFNGGVPKGGAAVSNVNLDLTGILPGYHEVQLILIADDSINQRTIHTIPIWVGPSNAIQLTPKKSTNEQSARAVPTFSVKSDIKLPVTVRSPKDCTQISLWHNFELLTSLETVAESENELSVELGKLGMGPVRLQAKAKLSDGKEIASIPVWVDIQP